MLGQSGSVTQLTDDQISTFLSFGEDDIGAGYGGDEED
jgi:hypothetical protein